MALFPLPPSRPLPPSSMFLSLQPKLLQAHRSKSLTQIDCIEQPDKRLRDEHHHGLSTITRAASSFNNNNPANPSSSSNISSLQQQHHHPQLHQQQSGGSLKGNKSRGQLARRSGGIFSNPFRTDREKMDQLSELLNQYSQHGIPDYNSHYHHHLSHPLRQQSSHDSSISVDHNSSNVYDCLYLEEHWRCLVKDSKNMPKKLQSQQDAIWELLHTEVFYIKRLKVISDLFLTCLHNLQSECLLNDVSKKFISILYFSFHLLFLLSYFNIHHRTLRASLANCSRSTYRCYFVFM